MGHGAIIGIGLLAGVAAALWPRRDAAMQRITSARPDVPDYAPREFQTTCDPTPKAGTKAFRDWVLANYGGRSGGIARACDVGGKSEHKEGRGWDWFPPDKETADRLIVDLLATDRWGRSHALARRWGIQYFVWYRRMWRAYSDRQGPGPGWRAYAGKSPHTDHVHFTQSKKRAADGTTIAVP